MVMRMEIKFGVWMKSRMKSSRDWKVWEGEVRMMWWMEIK